MIKSHKILAAFFCLILLIVGIGVYLVSDARVGKIISNKASGATDRKIEISNDLDIDWGWPVTRVSANNVTLGNFTQGSRPEMLKIAKATVAINLPSLFRRLTVLPEITLDQPDLLLEKDKSGHANWDFTQNTGAHVALKSITPNDRKSFPAIGKLVINNGKITYNDAVTDTKITMDAETITGAAQKHQELHFEGTGTYKKHDFAVTIRGGNVFQLNKDNKPYPVDLQAKIGDTKISLVGTMLDPLQFKGMNTTLTLSGKNAAELFDVAGIALPPTPPYNVTGDLKYEDDVWYFQDFSGHMGSSDLNGSVTWDTTKDRPLLSGVFESKRLNLADLGGLIGAGPGANSKTKNDDYLIPDTPLDISRLKSMDAKVVFTSDKLISPSLPLDDFAMNIDLDNSLLTLHPIRFGTAKGDISADMTVNARQEPVQIGGDFRFHRLDLKPIFAGLAKTLGTPNYAQGYVGGTAKLNGTGKSLRQMLATSQGNIGLGMEGGQLSSLVISLLGLDVAKSLGLYLGGDQPVPVRCMIGDFKVTTGLMQVRHFVLDTTKSNIIGTGDINLKNEELNLTLYPNPKSNSILSLNSPIGLRGTLKHPALDVSQAAGRGAAGVALGALIFPVAAIVAFVEPALGKDSPCAALINEMNRHTGEGKASNLIPKNANTAKK